MGKPGARSALEHDIRAEICQAWPNPENGPIWSTLVQLGPHLADIGANFAIIGRIVASSTGFGPILKYTGLHSENSHGLVLEHVLTEVVSHDGQYYQVYPHKHY